MSPRRRQPWPCAGGVAGACRSLGSYPLCVTTSARLFSVVRLLISSSSRFRRKTSPAVLLASFRPMHRHLLAPPPRPREQGSGRSTSFHRFPRCRRRRLCLRIARWGAPSVVSGPPSVQSQRSPLVLLVSCRSTKTTRKSSRRAASNSLSRSTERQLRSSSLLGRQALARGQLIAHEQVRLARILPWPVLPLLRPQSSRRPQRRRRSSSLLHSH